MPAEARGIGVGLPIKSPAIAGERDIHVGAHEQRVVDLGRETRRIVKKKAREGSEALSETGRDLWDKGRDLYEKGLKVADDAAEMIERGRKLVEG